MFPGSAFRRLRCPVPHPTAALAVREPAGRRVVPRCSINAPTPSHPRSRAPRRRDPVVAPPAKVPEILYAHPPWRLPFNPRCDDIFPCVSMGGATGSVCVRACAAWFGCGCASLAAPPSLSFHSVGPPPRARSCSAGVGLLGLSCAVALHPHLPRAVTAAWGLSAIPPPTSLPGCGTPLSPEAPRLLSLVSLS